MIDEKLLIELNERKVSQKTNTGWQEAFEWSIDQIKYLLGLYQENQECFEKSIGMEQYFEINYKSVFSRLNLESDIFTEINVKRDKAKRDKNWQEAFEWSSYILEQLMLGMEELIARIKHVLGNEKYKQILMNKMTYSLLKCVSTNVTTQDKEQRHNFKIIK